MEQVSLTLTLRSVIKQWYKSMVRFMKTFVQQFLFTPILNFLPPIVKLRVAAGEHNLKL